MPLSISCLAVNPVTNSVTISRPREEVFSYLADIANHAEFMGHFMREWHLTRLESRGKGAGARFRMKLPFNRFSWNDITFVECESPYKIVAQGRGGKFNRIKTYATWTLAPASGNGTYVSYTYETEPAFLSDRIVESFGARSKVRRSTAKALTRLRRILEDNEARGRRATVAGM